MSTFTTLKLALTGARSAYNTYADFRDRKMDEAYGALSTAAETYGPKADDAVESARQAYDESMKKAGSVTKAARVRLEKALAAAEEQGGETLKNVRSSGKQMNRKARRKAAKLDKKGKKNASKQLARVGKKESHWARNLAVAALTASGVAALVYAVVNKRKDIPGTTPPRVEDQFTQTEEAVEEDAPVLVYSTVTGDDDQAPDTAEELTEDIVADAEATAVADADLEAEVTLDTEDEDAADVGPLTEPETAEELVEDLSEAEALQADFDAKNAPQRDQSEK